MFHKFGATVLQKYPADKHTGAESERSQGKKCSVCKTLTVENPNPASVG